MKKMDASQVRFLPYHRLIDEAGLADPNGRVFYYQGEVYRAIRESRAEFVRSLFDRGIVEELTGENLLVDTRLTDLHLEGYGLVLQHRKLDLVSRPAEWSHVTYIQAARQFLRLAKRLSRHKLALVDGHHGNMSLGLDGVPFWHDFGSIIPNPGSLPLLNEFAEDFYYPLLYLKKTGSVRLLRRLNFTLTREEYGLLNRSMGQRFLQSALSLGIPRSLSQSYQSPLGGIGVRNILSVALEGFIHGRGPGYERLLDLMERTVESLSARAFSARGAEFDGRGPALPPRDGGERLKAVASAVEEVKPARLLDLRADAGLFSHAAYGPCPVVIAADPEESRVADHAAHLMSSRAGKRIYPVVLGLMEMSPEQKDRFRSPAVLALGLPHLLRLRGHYPWDPICKSLGELAEHSLITEFLPRGLGTGEPLPSPLPRDYTLDDFTAALKKNFSSVSPLGLPSAGGTSLLICRK